MSKRKCGLCGKDPAEGFASVDDTFYCHGDYDPEPTCYMRSQSVPVLTEKNTAVRDVAQVLDGYGNVSYEFILDNGTPMAQPLSETPDDPSDQEASQKQT